MEMVRVREWIVECQGVKLGTVKAESSAEARRLALKRFWNYTGDTPVRVYEEAARFRAGEQDR